MLNFPIPWMWYRHECVSVHLAFLFLASAFCNFQHTDLIHVLVGVYLSIFFGVIGNTIVFLISVFAYSLLVNRNAIDFCALILYVLTSMK